MPSPLSQALQAARLYAIIDTGYLGTRTPAFYAAALCAGGAGIIQLRAKKSPPEAILKLAQEILPITQAAGVPLIINDHPHLAAELRAEGAHVGQDDATVSITRAQAAPDQRPILIGQSTHSLAQALAADRAPTTERPDYIGFGPLFATPTKPDYTPIGLDDIRAVHAQVSLPIFCIGGIKLDNLPPVLEAGARRIVVVSGILCASDPEQYCRSLRALLDPLPLPVTSVTS